ASGLFHRCHCPRRVRQHLCEAWPRWREWQKDLLSSSSPQVIFSARNRSAADGWTGRAMAGQHVAAGFKPLHQKSMQKPAVIMIEAFRQYRDQWQGEAATVAQFEVFLRTHADAFERSNPVGHFTGSSWLVSADGARVLLMHHRKLDRWLQPGGHADGDADLARVALREAQEDTGI